MKTLRVSAADATLLVFALPPRASPERRRRRGEHRPELGLGRIQKGVHADIGTRATRSERSQR